MPLDPADPIARTLANTIKASGLGKTKLYELIKRGELPIVVVDGRTLILDEDLRECLARRRVYRGNGEGAASAALEAAQMAADRGARGRPAGSAPANAETAAEPPTKRGRGRPRRDPDAATRC